MKKEKTITRSVRWTPKEDEKLEKKAEKAGMSMSEYIRRAALNSRTRVRKVPEEKARLMTQTQVCINELLIMEESGNELSEAKKIKIAEIQEGMNALWTSLK
jgi:hypothetical protein